MKIHEPSRVCPGVTNLGRTLSCLAIASIAWIAAAACGCNAISGIDEYGATLDEEAAVEPDAGPDGIEDRVDAPIDSGRPEGSEVASEVGDSGASTEAEADAGSCTIRAAGTPCTLDSDCCYGSTCPPKFAGCGGTVVCVTTCVYK